LESHSWLRPPNQTTIPRFNPRRLFSHPGHNTPTMPDGGRVFPALNAPPTGDCGPYGIAVEPAKVRRIMSCLSQALMMERHGALLYWLLTRQAMFAPMILRSGMHPTGSSGSSGRSAGLLKSIKYGMGAPGYGPSLLKIQEYLILHGQHHDESVTA